MGKSGNIGTGSAKNDSTSKYFSKLQINSSNFIAVFTG
jgi:hypothetical protein